MTDSTIDFATGAPAAGSLDVSWIHGAPARRRPSDPPIQVHRYDEHTVILRQSKSVHYEAPFLYLLFGNDRALLLDTGATADPEKFPLRATIDQLVGEWLTRHPREAYELVVAHTHGHGDRGRVLGVTGSPGHHRAAITVYDPWTGFLLTGDTVYPGRLYVSDFPQFLASLDRMTALADSRAVTHVLGCHIEMTRRPGRDYPIGSTYQPAEPPLEMTAVQLGEIRAAAASVASKRGIHRFDDFIIYNGMGVRTQLPLVARALVARARDAVTSRR